MYDIVVIGAGAAGLTAAIYATRAEKKVLVLEGKTYGGQIINSLSVENYPGMYKVSGPDFAKALYEQAKELGAEIGFEAVTKVNKLENGFEIVTEDDKYEAKVVISELLSEDGKFAGVVLSSTDGETGDAVLGEPKELRAEGLFVAIGSKPSSEVFEGLVEMDENGYIVASEDCKTSVPGIFVAGDVRTSSLKQLVTATADGARAATEAVKVFSY